MSRIPTYTPDPTADEKWRAVCVVYDQMPKHEAQSVDECAMQMRDTLKTKNNKVHFGELDALELFGKLSLYLAEQPNGGFHE